MEELEIVPHRQPDFARQENRSVSYMPHFVKDTMNQTFQDHVNSVRFNRTRQSLILLQQFQKQLDQI